MSESLTCLVEVVRSVKVDIAPVDIVNTCAWRLPSPTIMGEAVTIAPIALRSSDGEV